MSSTESVETFEFEINLESELVQVINLLVKLSKTYRIFLLEGDLGAGKTTLVQHFVRSFNEDIQVSSPSFSLIQEYAGSPKVIHMDLYRLATIEDLLNIGIEDFLHDHDTLLFIEWPEIAMDLMPDSYVKINIGLEDEVRIIKVNAQHSAYR